MPQKHQEPGYTLLELIVVIFLIGTVMFFSVPRFQAAVLPDPAKAASRYILTVVPQLKERAVREKTVFTLHISMEDNAFWISDPAMTEEDRENAMQQGYELPESVRILDVEYPGNIKLSSGQADLRFYPQGHSDQAWIHLENDEGEQSSLLVQTFLPKVKLIQEYIGF